MRNGYKIISWVGILIAAALISCKTTPAPEAAPPAATPESPAAPSPADPGKGPPDQAAIDALEAARAQVEASRTQAVDIESPRYFPRDWETAEGQYQSLGEPASATLGEFRAAAETYRAVAKAFDDLARKCLPRYAADREQEIRAAREGAVKAGAERITPDRLRAADAMVEKAVSQYDAEDYYPAAASAFTAVDMYKALEAGLGAYTTRREIVARDFVKYEPVNFEFADTISRAAVSGYDAGHIPEARNKAEQARLWYSLVLDIGWETFASEHGAAAAKVQEDAYALKAHVALKKDYDAATEILKQGDVSFSNRQFAEAVTRYTQAESRFITVRDAAREKRRLAEDAIREAEEKVIESDENARDAEIILEGDTL
ncbi:MAG: hypothetical protein LBG08_01770 [Spirochaetaceae bacterium]|jgi:hypothetical protein|nr:hypothetical protein [Spirochaetaceae bacterium]